MMKKLAGYWVAMKSGKVTFLANGRLERANQIPVENAGGPSKAPEPESSRAG
jgi:hypothetical protein